MAAETTVYTKQLSQPLIAEIGRTVSLNYNPAQKPSISTWQEQVYKVRTHLLRVGERDNRYVHAILSPFKISTAVQDIGERLTGSNHPHLMARFGNVRAALKRGDQPVAKAAQETVTAINLHTPDATNIERVQVFTHLLGQAGIEVTPLSPDTNPADRFNCKGDEALLVSGEKLFLGFARNKYYIEAQARNWETPYANLQ